MPYGNVYTFRVGILDNGVEYWSQESNEIDLSLSIKFTYLKHNKRVKIVIFIEWKEEPIVKRIGFEQIEIEWQKSDNYKLSRIRFEMNGNGEVQEYPTDNYEFIKGNQ